MNTYSVVITGRTPLLMHQDNIDWSDQLGEWLSDPQNKKMSKAGDDRTPAWTWIGSLCHDDSVVMIPADYLARCMMEGGAMVPVPNSKHGKTFKAQTMSGMMPDGAGWPVLVDGAQIDVKPILDLVSCSRFSEHKAAAKSAGFALFSKRAKIGQSKHVRVRPRFDTWAAAGTVTVWDEQITQKTLGDILTNAGRYKGLGDWRPGSRTPGPFGTFDAVVTKQ